MATEIQTLEPKAQLNITTQPQPFVSAFENLGKSSTFLGDLGATIAQESSIQYNKIRGLEYGQNPQGDLLPPITTADKAFAQGYLAQSQNTLSLQANQMFNQAELELDKSYKLSPGQVNEFQKQMTQGLESIMSVAPTEVRNKLGYQYGVKLDSLATQYRSKIINQSKSDAIDSMKVNDKLTDQNINNLATTGKFLEAKKLYDEKVLQNQRQFESGMMSRSELETSNASAKITYHQGIYNNKLLELESTAKNKSPEAIDKLRGEFLQQFTNYKNKPSELNADEWTTIGNNTLAFQQHLNNMESIAVNYAFADLSLKASQGTISNLDIQKVADMPGVTETKMNQWLAKFKNAQTKINKETTLTNSILSDYSNTKLWAETTSDKAKDNAYFQVVNRLNEPKAPFRAATAAPMQNEAIAASQAGGPVPAFNRILGGLSRSNNPSEVRSAYNAYQTVRLSNPKNLYGLNNDVSQTLQLFGAITRTNPQMGDDQVLQTMMAVQNRNKDQNDIINEKWKEESQGAKGHLATPMQKSNFARDILNNTGTFESKIPLLNQNEITANIMSIMKSNFFYAGDYDTAKEMTTEAVNLVYGPSKVSGRNMIQMYPLEKMSGIDNSHFFFQKDIVEQTQEKFKTQEIAAKQGLASTYYRIKNPEQYNLENITDSDYQRIINKSSPIIVETVRINNGKESVVNESELIADINQETQLSSNPGNPISGSFDLSLVDKTGFPTLLHYYGGYNPTSMTYTPNFEKVQNEFDLMYAKFGKTPMSNTEEIIQAINKFIPEKAPKISTKLAGRKDDIEGYIEQLDKL